MFCAVAAAQNTGWRWLNKWDEAHKTELTVWANCLTWWLSKKREEWQWCHCSVSDLGQTPGELSHMWLCGVNFSCTAGPWRHSANTGDYVCVHQHFADTTPFFFFFFFRACAVTVAAGQRQYSHHRQNFIATAVAAALRAEAGLSLPSSVPLQCGYLLQKTHHYFSFTCGSQTLKRQKVNETFWTRRRVS